MATQTSTVPPGGTTAGKPEWKENLTIQAKCPECKEDPPNVIEEFSSGDTVCASCGLVIGERIIDTRSEWRTFSNDDQGSDDPSRVGEAANPLLNGAQLQTTISFGDGIKSRELARAQSKTINADKSNKILQNAYRDVDGLCNAYGIPSNAAMEAKHYFKLVVDTGHMKGKNPEAIVAGCVHLGCRITGNSRSFREIHAMSRVPKAEIGKAFKLLKFLHDKQKVKVDGLVSNDASHSTAALSLNAKEVCSRFCGNLGLTQRYVRLSEDIAVKVQDIGALAGRSPLSVAAACIYMASYLLGTPKSPKEIAVIAGVSDGTIRTSYKQIYREKDTILKGSKWETDAAIDFKRLPSG